MTLGSFAHHRDGLARKDELADTDIDPIHPGQKKIIAAAGVDDQELSVGAERPGESDPAVGR